MEAYIMERGYVSPNDAGIMAQTDSRSIQNAVNAALASGLGKVVIPRYNKRTGACRWDVDEAVILDSGLEIVLDNCYIRQMDGSMDNVFRNHDDIHIRKTLAEEQHNIIIRGQGNAVIDGGNHNGLSQETSLLDGRPHVEKNNIIRLHNLRYFRLENFTILNQRWWAINLCHVEEGMISGLHISCGAEGRNLDGIDLRFGCNNITIQDLTGQSQDDFIALSAFRSAAMIDKYQVEGKTLDIHDINIRNIAATSAECAVIALRNQDGIKIYNITMDGIYDTITSQELAVKNPSFAFRAGFDNNRYSSPKSPYAVIRIGQEGWIRDYPCAPGDVHSIYVNNVRARCNSAVMINMHIENCYFGNIYAADSANCVISTSSCRSRQTYGANIRDTVFENIFYECKDNKDSLAFAFVVNTKAHTMQNVHIRNAFLGNCGKVLEMQHAGDLTLTNINCTDLRNKISVCPEAQVTLDGERL